MKRFLQALAILVAVLAVSFLWLLWELGRFGNWDVEFGYYGHFNRVKHVLEEMPNVAITNDWQHHDVTLEDFGFSLVVDGSQSVHINFHENSPEMKMRNKSRIRQFIEEKIEEDSNNAPGTYFRKSNTTP